MKRPPVSQDPVIRAQFEQVFNFTVALQHACNTADKCMPYFMLCELLRPLAEELQKLNVICDPTPLSETTHRMFGHLLLQMELFRTNQTNVHPRRLGVLLGPLLAELKKVVKLYTKADSNRKAAQAANSKSKAVNQENDECELTEPLPTQEPPIRDGLLITTPSENILELIVASLTGKQDDIWTKYQACLPADLTSDEVKTANDSFMAMLKEHII